MRAVKPFRATRSVIVLTVVAGLAPLAANAQEHRLPQGSPLPDDARVYLLSSRDPNIPLADNPLHNILLTGYWPPTNEMLRQFSTNPAQNPGGWVGENWEGRGYNVYAFFPEFPGGLGKGEGDFEVDYQDTSYDFWRVTDVINPMAIITFGRASDNFDWEVEDRHRNRTSWTMDYEDPYLPTPNPPDGTVGAYWRRDSSLPQQEIVDAVNAAGLGLNAFIDYAYAGDFLCEFIAYHACWYHEMHDDPDDPNDPVWNVAGGHIHLGGLIPVSSATQATEITVRTLIAYLDQQTLTPGDMDCDGLVDFGDINPFVLALLDPNAYHAQYPKCPWRNGDCDDDGWTDFGDINPFVEMLLPP